jgi:hypothetical protein
MDIGRTKRRVRVIPEPEPLRVPSPEKAPVKEPVREPTKTPVPA